MASLMDFHFVGGSRGQALKALRQLYPKYSSRRWVLRALNAINQAGPRLCPKGVASLGRASEALPELPPGMCRAFLLHKISQNGRAYIFDRMPDGCSVSVTKLATTEAAAVGLRREAKVLLQIAGRTEFLIPNVLAFDTWEGGCLLRVAAAPSGYVTHDHVRPLPPQVYKAIEGLRPPHAAGALPFQEFDGCREALGRATEPAITAWAPVLNSRTAFAATAAHRDLGSQNILSRAPAKSPSDFFIIDWEYYSDTAPALTDQVGFWLGGRHRTLKTLREGGRRQDLASQFTAEFANAPGGSAAAVLALLHLAYLGIDLACNLTGEEVV